MMGSVEGGSLQHPPLLTGQDARSQVHLIIGSNSLASARCTRSLELGAVPTILAPPDATFAPVLRQKIEDGKVKWVQREFQDQDLNSLGREEVDNYVDAVFVTIGAHNPLSLHISKLCRRQRIPVNVADAPELCTFTLLSTYSDGPLHVGITTSGRGCKLASRIRREIASFLPSSLGSAIEVLGSIRKKIWEEDMAEGSTERNFNDDDEDSPAQSHTFNSLVVDKDPTATKTRRIRWMSQLCEYWPLRRLAAITGADMDKILAAYRSATDINRVEVGLEKKKGKIILAGSGPGHPDLLTMATCQAIKNADLVLSDKLVPSGVLDLIPRRTEVHIARKFPGNADKAQEELLSMALEGLHAGRTVLRLKQGDPYLYGRGAEEYHFFKSKGYIPAVLPGITSSLSAPVFADIPPTHRGVADQVLICTGTGRHGVMPDPPTFVPTQTVVFLMALHRLSTLVESLTTASPENTEDHKRRLWPKETPCAVIERASCADQRVIRTTLEHVCLAVQEEGSRPPGLLVVGKSCEVLYHPGTEEWVVEDGYRALEDLGIKDESGFVEDAGLAEKS